LVVHVERGMQAEIFENRVLRRISGPKRDEVTGSGEDYITRSFTLYIPHQI
jgi:hypothetical protein